ncbi:MAG: heavy-metal-associated domain-containing protein [Halodesulfurarchaeum sp.]
MTRTITVTGMTCEHCEQTVEEALESLSGVTSATADREAESATIEGDVSLEAAIQAVDDAGYEASA